MLLTVQAEFDGKSFVPSSPVQLPAGTRVVLSIQPSTNGPSPVLSAKPPGPITEEHKRLWEELQREWAANPPEEATLEECMRKLRGPSWS